jgi:redox-sensing transcriptional repressor
MATHRTTKGKPGAAPEVPKAVVSRLSLYLRELQRLVRDGHATVSSLAMGELLACSPAQFRKDLAYFGHFGHPGVGYRCEELVSAIRKILGTDQRWPVALVGAGNLGRALLGYRGFEQQGFEIVAAFDLDEAKVGQPIDHLRVEHASALPQRVQALRIKLGIIAVPARSAQAVADRLVEAGIEGIVNFAPVTISVPDRVSLVGVDLAMELEQLTFAVQKSGLANVQKTDDPNGMNGQD